MMYQFNRDLEDVEYHTEIHQLYSQSIASSIYSYDSPVIASFYHSRFFICHVIACSMVSRAEGDYIGAVYIQRLTTTEDAGGLDMVIWHGKSFGMSFVVNQWLSDCYNGEIW